MKRDTTIILKAVIIAVLSLLLYAGGAVAQQQGDQPGTQVATEVENSASKAVLDVYDPIEGFNRGAYVFNYYVDKYFILPVVGAYEWITPDYVEDRISGIFSNLSELKNFTNNLLQLKLKNTAVTTGRFIVNSTVGILGMYDPATDMGMIEHKEDFGQTLGYYGVGPGPYLVLPLFGPSSLRDGGGLIVDSAIRSAVMDWATDDLYRKSLWRDSINVGDAIDTRHKIKFRYYQSGSPFEYDMIRLLYTEKRKMDVAK